MLTELLLCGYVVGWSCLYLFIWLLFLLFLVFCLLAGCCFVVYLLGCDLRIVVVFGLFCKGRVYGGGFVAFCFRGGLRVCCWGLIVMSGEMVVFV